MFCSRFACSPVSFFTSRFGAAGVREGETFYSSIQTVRFGMITSRSTSCHDWESERLFLIGRTVAGGGALYPFSRSVISAVIVPSIRWRLSFDRSGLRGSFDSTSRSASSSTARPRRSPRWRESFMIFSMRLVDDEQPNHTLQRTRPSRHCCNRCVPRAGSLSLGR